MKRILAGLLILCCVSASGCAGLGAGRVAPGRIHHIVLCWLKRPGNVEDRARIIEVSRGFASIPGILDVRVGSVVLSERKIVDDTFDVGLVMSFASEDDMALYVKHPDHENAVKDVLMPLVSRIVVYDFVE